jgi:hypothetical protein
MADTNMNEEFDLDGLDESVSESAPSKEVVKAIHKAKAAPKRKAAQRKAAPAKATPKKKVWIMIDEVPGMSNFETVGHNGSVIQVKRGVPVEVDEKYVHVLELAVQTSITESSDPLTGEKVDTTNHFSSIPWRQVPAPR